MIASALDRPPDTQALRTAMVASQLRTTGVDDPRVVAAMDRVPRERFLPGVAPALAYRDQLVPIGRGRHANLPMATGKLLTAAYLRAEDRVLLIGAAGGYTAAVLAGIVREVVAVESDATLAGHARDALVGTPNVRLVTAPLPEGDAEHATYDVLVIDGAVESVPASLWSQLAVNGRVVTGIANRGVTRLASGVRAAGGLGLEPFADVACALLPGFAQPRRFEF